MQSCNIQTEADTRDLFVIYNLCLNNIIVLYQNYTFIFNMISYLDKITQMIKYCLFCVIFIAVGICMIIMFQINSCFSYCVTS